MDLRCPGYVKALLGASDLPGAPNQSRSFLECRCCAPRVPCAPRGVPFMPVSEQNPGCLEDREAAENGSLPLATSRWTRPCQLC